MTRKEQIMISNEMFDVHFAMDIAAELLQDTIDLCPELIFEGKDLKFKNEKIKARLEAISEFLYQARLKMNFVTGEETPLTETYKQNAARLMAYHDIDDHK